MVLASLSHKPGMTIYKNAIESIQIGVEDFGANDPRRILSAVRNLQAGTILLCKEKLARMSPDGDSLLKVKLLPVVGADGLVAFKGQGKKTVDIQGIKERFESLDIKFAWKAVDRLTDIRNDMEHMFFKGGAKLAEEAVSDAFIAVRELLLVVLEEEPVGALGPACWGALLANNKLFEQEVIACRKTLDAVKWRSAGAAEAAEEFICPECGSKLVKQLDADNDDQTTAMFMCSACGEEIETTLLIVAGVATANAAEAYSAAKDGGEDPVGTCPDCGEDTYVFADSKCAHCGFEMPDDAECMCGERLTLEDYAEGDGLCSYHRYALAKDD